MRVKLHDGKVLEVKEPTEKHLIDYLVVTEKHDELVKNKKQLEAAKLILDTRNKTIQELSGLSSDDVRNMCLVDQQKVFECIKSRYVYSGQNDYRTDF